MLQKPNSEIKMPNYQKAYSIDDPDLKAVHEKPISVETYNRCRYISPKALNSFIDVILRDRPKKILEAGVGDGRIFVPLVVNNAEHSTEFIGLDISKPMLNKLNEKLGESSNVVLYKADIQDEDFFQENINEVDCVYTFATLHILSNEWKKGLDNLTNCLSKEGEIILGEEINSVFHGSEKLYESDDFRLSDLNQKFKGEINREELKIINNLFIQYHRLREKYDYPFLRFNSQILHGDQSPAERYLRNRGFTQRTFHGRNLQWIKPHSLEDILSSIKQRTVTTLGSDLPDKIREKIVGELEDYCRLEKYNIKKKIDVPSEIQLHIFSK